MRRRTATMIALMIPAAVAEAQTVRLPQGGGGIGSGPTVVIPQTPGTGGTPGGLTTTLPNPGLQGTIPVPKPAPQVIPPTAGRPGAPDGGDATSCNCFVVESTPIVGPDGRVSYIQRRRATGQKHLSCCPR